ncbi:MAG TPA: LytTR family DNA-binding domain-containing protein [Bacteroidales bacterium]|nr:LytTR family DNA-binding domain-containing protein [Bacteroidales bacterium]
MNKKSKNPYLHIAYWIFVILVLSRAFGFSWGNNTAAFFFVCMLLPIVLGTSYFFNYVLVPQYYLKKRYTKFAFYTFCTAVVSLYFEMLVLVISYVYLVNLDFHKLSPNATQIGFLAVTLYLLVFIGSFLLMMRQIVENRQVIQQLMEEKEKMKKSFLEILSNRKIAKIPYDEIVYIESLSDYIQVNTLSDQIMSKEKISHLASRLPDIFLRIHRSFIINTEKIKNISCDEVMVNDVLLTIGRSYRKAVKESLNNR